MTDNNTERRLRHELEQARSQLSECQQQVSTLTAQLSRRTTEALQIAERLSACQRELEEVRDCFKHESAMYSAAQQQLQQMKEALKHEKRADKCPHCDGTGEVSWYAGDEFSVSPCGCPAGAALRSKDAVSGKGE